MKELHVPGTKLQLKSLPSVEKGSSGIAKDVGIIEGEVLEARLRSNSLEEENQKRNPVQEKGKAGVSAGQAKSTSSSSSVSTGQSAANATPTAVSSDHLDVKMVAGSAPPPESNIGDNSFQQCLQNMAQREEASVAMPILIISKHHISIVLYMNIFTDVYCRSLIL